MLIFKPFFLVSIVLTIAACGKSTPKEAPAASAPGLGLSEPANAFNKDIQPILIENCSACHSEGSKFPSLFVGNEAVFRQDGEAIMASLVNPDPKKVMPKHHSPLTAAQQAKMRLFLDSPAVASAPPPEPKTPFERDILPYLVKECGACHTPGADIRPVFVSDEITFRNFGAGILASFTAPGKGRMPPSFRAGNPGSSAKKTKQPDGSVLAETPDDIQEKLRAFLSN